METAFLNLLDNPVRFSPPGKPVQVEVCGEAPSLEIAIHDESPGISPKKLPMIFDRFFSTDADRHGTGPGLAIVKAVIEAHGGKVSVESEPGKGTTVRVKLPAPR
jgi:signal transduction histidine kinase